MLAKTCQAMCMFPAFPTISSTPCLVSAFLPSYLMLTILGALENILQPLSQNILFTIITSNYFQIVISITIIDMYIHVHCVSTFNQKYIKMLPQITVLLLVVTKRELSFCSVDYHLTSCFQESCSF